MPNKSESPVRDRTVAARIVDLIQAEGIDTIFGIPDPGFQRMFRVAAERGMRVVAPHHEAAGGFMADAMTRMTGKPSVVIGNQGPGVANLLPAAVCASKEKAPVLFLAGQRDRVLDAQVRRGKFQYTPQPRFFEAAMKYVGIIEFPEQVDEIFHEAFRQALTGTPGPVYVEYPKNLTNIEVDLGPAAPPERYRLVHQQADPSAVEKAAEMLSKAEMPLLLVGAGCRNARAVADIAALAATLRCPVVPTWSGRGVLADSHQQVLLYSSPAANDAIAAADVVLAIGTNIGEQIHYGTGRHWAHGCTDRRWIYVERDPTAIGVNRPIDVPLVGDLRDVVPQLVAALERHPARNAPPALRAWKAAHEDARRARVEAAPDTFPIHPGRMIREVSRVLPPDAVMVRDGGCTALFEVGYNQWKHGDQLATLDFGHLGTGLPYAIGAQLAVGPERRVCLITGDSSLLFHISELETAVRKHLPIVVIVNSDGAWGMERPGFVQEFGFGSEVEVGWGAVRFDKIAEGFGAHGEYVDRTADIAPAVERALAAGRAAVVQVAVDPMANSLQAPDIEEFLTWYAGSMY
jgi:thiamine pyrophosphate-dependent acetolactate synthase large subunit-like protein